MPYPIPAMSGVMATAGQQKSPSSGQTQKDFEALRTLANLGSEFRF